MYYAIMANKSKRKANPVYQKNLKDIDPNAPDLVVDEYGWDQIEHLPIVTGKQIGRAHV